MNPKEKRLVDDLCGKMVDSIPKIFMKSKL